MKHVYQYERGQTLLELVVAIGVVAIITTALVVAATSSLRYGQESRLRSTAVKYAQEGLELARQIRDSQSSDTFLSYAGMHCLNYLGGWSDGSSGCSPIQSGSPYTRTVTFTWNDPTMIVTSKVSWNVGGSTVDTEVTTHLTQWR